jgi:hypothetical protein
MKAWPVPDLLSQRMGAMLAKRAQRDSKHVCGRPSHAHASVGMAPDLQTLTLIQNSDSEALA